VLQNVRVIAAGHTLEHSATGEAQNTAVITLLVSPDDAQRLTLASSQGHIQLALRSPLDTKQDDVASSSARGLYKGAPAPAVTPVKLPRAVVVRKPAAPTSPASSVVSVEVIEGDKKPVVVPFPEQGSDTKGPDTK
jgi:pilus assembly protein CpaB